MNGSLPPHYFKPVVLNLFIALTCLKDCNGATEVCIQGVCNVLGQTSRASSSHPNNEFI